MCQSCLPKDQQKPDVFLPNSPTSSTIPFLSYEQKSLYRVLPERLKSSLAETLLDTIEITGMTVLTDKKKSGKERPWQKYKMSSLDVADAFKSKSSLFKRSERVQACGTYLEFKECCNDTTHPKSLETANFCRDRMCPLCAWRKSLLMGYQLGQVAQALSDEGYRFIFLTLTVPNVTGAVLKEKVRQMTGAWTKLRKKPRFMESIAGSFRGVEVTYNNEDDTHHPHIHALLCVKPEYFDKHCDLFIAQDVWLTMWQDCMADWGIKVVDVRAVKGKQLQKACSEVAKYATKPADWSGLGDKKKQVILDLASGLERAHLQQWGGIMEEKRRELGFVDDVDKASLKDLIAVTEEGEKVTELCEVCKAPIVTVPYRWMGTDYVSRRVVFRDVNQGDSPS